MNKSKLRFACIMLWDLSTRSKHLLIGIIDFPVALFKSVDTG